jgi:hypothetical protein
LNGFVQIPGGDQDEAANLLFGLREWASIIAILPPRGRIVVAA